MSNIIILKIATLDGGYMLQQYNGADYINIGYYKTHTRALIVAQTLTGAL
ncbi:hypothetical protein [Caudoviricetes sp.]|nr:hypothetical protein [Caudoviricetes sp.]